MKKFFIVLMLTLVLGVSLCGCLQWLEIPDEHYSQASLVEAPKKESPLCDSLVFYRANHTSKCNTLTKKEFIQNS